MRVRVGCELSYTSSQETPMQLLVQARRESRYHRTVSDTKHIEPQASLRTYTDLYGNQAWRTQVGPAPVTVRYDAVAQVPATPDLVLPGLAKTSIAELPDEVLLYTLSSRYC
ncbi:MAG: transglutaminase family protein, partial [Deinococcota bacterium]|nr:transglutaminase family protein [Deinococcota bacterium]